MKAMIGVELMRQLPTKDVDIRDTKLSGFVLRCRKSGRHSYRAQIGRARAVTIGPVDRFTPLKAREEARRILAEASLGRDPIAENRAARAAVTFKVYLDKHYEPWLLEHHKRGKETAQRLRSVFVDLLDLKLSELTTWTVEKWRTARLKRTDAKPATVNSHLTMLKAALSRAVAWRLLPKHPLGDIKPLKADKTGRVRYLTTDEETRLRKLLDARDAKRVQHRERANRWRRERGYAEWPADNSGHLTPIVLLALNTGMRKGEIFNLRWADVDLERAQLTVRGAGTKSSQTRYLPLNTEAVKTLRAWQGSATDTSGHVFPGRVEEEGLDDVKKAWQPIAAKFKNLTFHDLRHTFASKLVMAGVDLNTVRELLGHADLKMTLRYSHLAPEHKAAAVAKLVAR